MARASVEGTSETIAGAKELCFYYHQANVPTFVHGPPGVGKSAIFSQLAEELTEKTGKKHGFKDVRLANKLPEDISGIPTPDLDNMVARWLKADFWPDEKRDGKYGILLFDEMADANKQLQSTALQVVLDRKINEHSLPSGWWPCAAGNRRDDRASAQVLSTALADRFAHIDVRPDSKAFVQWCNENDIDPLIPGYINFRPDHIHTMEGSDGRAFATPRTWVQVAKICKAPKNMLFRLMVGLVGVGVAGEFNTYMQGLDLPSFDEVVKDPKNAHIPREPSSKYAMASMLARYASRENFRQVVTYCQRRDFGREFETVVALDATHRDATLCDTKVWVEWAQKNQDIHV